VVAHVQHDRLIRVGALGRRRLLAVVRHRAAVDLAVRVLAHLAIAVAKAVGRARAELTQAIEAGAVLIDTARRAHGRRLAEAVGPRERLADGRLDAAATGLDGVEAREGAVAIS